MYALGVRMRRFVLLLAFLGMLLLLPTALLAGEREEIQLKISFWQEHMQRLVLDMELSKIKLQEERTRLMMLRDAEQQAKDEDDDAEVDDDE